MGHGDGRGGGRWRMRRDEFSDTYSFGQHNFNRKKLFTYITLHRKKTPQIKIS